MREVEGKCTWNYSNNNFIKIPTLQQNSVLRIFFFPSHERQHVDVVQCFEKQNLPYFYFWNTAIIYEDLCFSSGRTGCTIKHKGLGSLSSKWIVCVILCQWSASLNSYKKKYYIKVTKFKVDRWLLESLCFFYIFYLLSLSDHDHIFTAICQEGHSSIGQHNILCLMCYNYIIVIDY